MSSTTVAEVLVRLGVAGLPWELWEPLRRDARRAIERALRGLVVTVELSARPELAGQVVAKAFGGDVLERSAVAARARQVAEAILRREVDG